MTFAVLCGRSHNIRKFLAHLRALLTLLIAAFVVIMNALTPENCRRTRQIGMPEVCLAGTKACSALPIALLRPQRTKRLSVFMCPIAGSMALRRSRSRPSAGVRRVGTRPQV